MRSRSKGTRPHSKTHADIIATDISSIDDVASWIAYVSKTRKDLELCAKDCSAMDVEVFGIHVYTFDDESKLLIAKGEARRGFLKAQLMERRQKADGHERSVA